MSSKSKIYAFCPAGCKYETVHKEDFLNSATYIPLSANTDGRYDLELGKEYKIFSDKIDNEFVAYIGFGSLTNSSAKSYIFENANNDKYAESFVFRLLEVNIGENSVSLVYETAGTRYEDSIDNVTASDYSSYFVRVFNATKVLRYNSDARIVVEVEGGEHIDVDTELSTKSENPVQNKVVTEELNKKLTNPCERGKGNRMIGHNNEGKLTYFAHSVTPLSGRIPEYRDGGVLLTNSVNEATGNYVNVYKNQIPINFGYFNANIGHRYKFTLTRTDDTRIKYHLYYDTKTNIDTITNTAIVDICKEFNNIPTLAYMSPFDDNPNIVTESVAYGVLDLKAAVDNGDGTPITINICGYINKLNNNYDAIETEILSFKQVTVTMAKVY